MIGGIAHEVESWRILVLKITDVSMRNFKENPAIEPIRILDSQHEREIAHLIRGADRGTL